MDDREALRRWVETWQRAGPELEAIRRKEIKEADNLQALAILERAFNHALRTLPPRHTSGLVDLHERLAKLSR